MNALSLSTARFQNFGTFARLASSVSVSILSKRSYVWDSNGDVHPAREQAPITHDISVTQPADRNGEIVTQGRDAWPIKVATDVIVTGHAHAPAGEHVHALLVAVSVGQHHKRIVAFGRRFARYRNGQISFSSPERLTSVDVSWANAYGGIDPMVLPEGLTDTPAIAGKPILELFPGAYPRNLAGTGYLIAETPDLIDGLELPQLEDPEHLLEPSSFLVRDPRAWWKCPLPAAFGWAHTLSFPRILHCGGKPYHLPQPPSEALRECQLGLVDDATLADPKARPMNVKLTNEAAPDMIMPFLRGNEVVRLRGFDAHGELRFRLPNERPEVEVAIDGESLPELATCIHTLAIDADARQFYMLHSTRFAASQALVGALREQASMDDVYPRCHATVDGHALERAHWPNPETAHTP